MKLFEAVAGAACLVAGAYLLGGVAAALLIAGVLLLIDRIT